MADNKQTKEELFHTLNARVEKESGNVHIDNGKGGHTTYFTPTKDERFNKGDHYGKSEYPDSNSKHHESEIIDKNTGEVVHRSKR